MKIKAFALLFSSDAQIGSCLFEVNAALSNAFSRR